MNTFSLYCALYSPVIPAEKGVAVSSPSADSATEATPGQDTGSGLMGWVKGYNTLLSKVAEKAKSSVDTVITTLDPQMRDLGLIRKSLFGLSLDIFSSILYVNVLCVIFNVYHLV